MRVFLSNGDTKNLLHEFFTEKSWKSGSFGTGEGPVQLVKAGPGTGVGKGIQIYSFLLRSWNILKLFFKVEPRFLGFLLKLSNF